jgi:formylglycine-generating enzyme required for sulfatase activity
MMKRVLQFTLCVLFLSSIASAELVQGISIDFVTIGNPGNPGDTRTDYPNSADPYGCGSVDYVYKIGKYEVTNAQWYDFVSAAGAPIGNPSSAYEDDAYWTGDNIPTNEVSWYEAAQFCNYLTSGDKSQGAYQFSGDNSNPGDFEGIDRDSAVSTYGIVYVIPTEDEWYKAAYYTGSGYSTYANGTDTPPIAGVDTNYDMAVGQPWDVGSGTQEQNGTYDIMGNVWEWNETLISGSVGSYRGVRGGSHYDFSGGHLGSSFRLYGGPGGEGSDVGFRVASVPEPCSLVLLSLGGLTLMRRRRVR